MALAEAPSRTVRCRWPSMLLRFLLIAAAAAPTASQSQGAGVREDTERAPKDALGLWVYRDTAGDSRIVLETADRVFVREWRSAEALDETIRREVREALDAITPPSRAVLIRVRPEVKFVTLKGLALACGAKEPTGYRTYVEVVATFPVGVLGPRR